MSILSILKIIFRTPYQSASAILIMVITFFVMSVFALLGIIAQGTLVYSESKPQFSAFYPVGTPEEEILTIKQSLEQTNKTIEVKYISPQEAVKILKEDVQNDVIEIDTDFISEGILPAALDIRAKSIADLRELREIVEQKEGVKVIFLEEIVNKLANWLNGIRSGGSILLSLLTIESILVIWTIIGLRVSQRKEEIEILELLGASNGFIQKPFLIEGIIYGGLGGLLGVSLTFLTFHFNRDSLRAFFGGEEIVELSVSNVLAITPFQQFLGSNASIPTGIPLEPMTTEFMLAFIILIVSLGALLGLIGAYVAAQRCKIRTF
jgi:cell division transport system permease protein